ncbi:thioredoxin-dependent thiol peroxidase [Acidipropionibacterium jensenii]|uniref:thioredoxin-dependent thiol peroxidase n=1 Tax=Acidipropionibacterium jensenii TaxID=1749 RepID=UPI000BC3436C|nr:thioredoxin-dependent thiol peroxidase [Acidipropionibacterium jensenii]AZZ42585.1 thioredoxin-dependent thiol peroxidase [Acidipropionibacterium jensenii]
MSIRLAPGSIAPDFTLPDASGHPVTLSKLTGQRVIVYFYPAAMTPGCTTQAVDFTTHHDAISAAGYTVLGISPDSVDRLRKFTEKESLTLTLLSDADTKVMRAYGTYGLKNVYGKEIEGVIRSTFVVDVQDDGRPIVSLAQYNVRAKGHVAKLCRELKI